MKKSLAKKSFVASLMLALGMPAVTSAQQMFQDQRPYSSLRWLAAFGASATDVNGNIVFSDQTVRQMAHVSVGTLYGIRIHLTNSLGAAPITLADVHVALYAGSRTQLSAAIVAGSDVPVTFGSGQSSVTIPANGEAISDYIRMPIYSTGADVVVSIYVPAGNTTAATEHQLGNTYVYYTAGDVSSATNIYSSSLKATNSRPFLSSIEVAAPLPSNAVVTLGDSITDGLWATPDTGTTWPDDLSARLEGVYQNQVSVVNAGISGNGLISNAVAPNAVARLSRDVLSVPGAKYVILLEGINDIGAAAGVTAAQLIVGYRNIIARAHEANLYVYGATLTPIGNSIYYSAAHEALRQSINAFIRTSGAFDGVIDFDKAIADPNNPTNMLAAYTADSLHPNDTGYQVLANAIDLTLFNPATH